MSVAIRLENISKQYRLGEVGTGTLSHDLHRFWAKLRGKPDPFAKVGAINDRTQSSAKNQEQRTKNGAASDYVWALKDIDFEVEQGEILGVIGRNGAGKSTLLKILSRVTAPTTGKVKTRGRIASLLEIGTGFHPELTGRENVYLSGAIMGMTRVEITKSLEEIVEFSGCAKYIDTPVKRYSSGMTVRLGFAVAAHLDCEILVVDEVLAVGDAEFQKKCIGKMQEISAGAGRTVLFVSHNMGAIKQLCSRAITLESGVLKSDSCDVALLIEQYFETRIPGEGSGIWETPKGNHRRNQEFELLRFYIEGYQSKRGIQTNEVIKMKIEFYIETLNPLLNIGLYLRTPSFETIYYTSLSDAPPLERPELRVGSNELEVNLPPIFLNEGKYFVELVAGIHNIQWIVGPGYGPTIQVAVNCIESESPEWTQRREGFLAPIIKWKTTTSNLEAGERR